MTTDEPVKQGLDRRTLLWFGLHHIRDDHLQGQLFDVQQDVWEHNELGRSPQGAELMSEYEALLDRLLRGGDASLGGSP